MRLLLCILPCICLVCGKIKAQNKETETVRKFVVKPVKYHIYPDDNYLFAGYENHLKIITNPPNSQYSLNVSNGLIKKTSDSTYIISSLQPAPLMLSISEVKAGGKTKIALNKAYTVLPFPTIKISGVKCDSAISKLMLASGTFYAEFKGFGKCKVKSFKMDMYINNEFVQDSSANGRLSQKMRQYLSQLKPGSLLYFKDLKYNNSGGVPKTEAIYRVFLIEDNLDIISISH